MNRSGIGRPPSPVPDVFSASSETAHRRLRIPSVAGPSTAGIRIRPCRTLSWLSQNSQSGSIFSRRRTTQRYPSVRWPGGMAGCRAALRTQFEPSTEIENGVDRSRNGRTETRGSVAARVRIGQVESVRTRATVRGALRGAHSEAQFPD